MPITKRPLRALFAVFGVIVAVVAFAVPASASPYSNQETTEVSDGTPEEGGTFTLRGDGFEPNEDVSNVLHSLPYTLTPAVANASGHFSVSVTLPSGVTGVHTISSTGATSGKVSSVTITIGGVAAGNAAASGTGGSLAFTGAAVIAIGSLAGLLLLGGVIMMFAGRRRRIVA